MGRRSSKTSLDDKNKRENGDFTLSYEEADHRETMKISIRKAGLNDIDEMARVVYSASELEPGFYYKYPNWRHFSSEILEVFAGTLRTYVNDTDPLWRWHVMVAEVQLKDDTTRIVSVAVWEVSALEGRKDTSYATEAEKFQSLGPVATGQSSTRPTPIPANAGGNAKHIATWKSTLDIARRKYLEKSDRINGPLSYLHIQLLFTERKYWAHGGASALMKWGIKKAQENHLSIGIFASAMAEVFLQPLGFQKLAKVVIEVEGEIERCVVSCMALPV